MESASPTIKVPAKTQCLEKIRSFCQSALEGHTRDRRLRRRLVLAIDEAAANVIEHAYRGPDKQGIPTIEITLDIRSDRIVVRIADRGVPFDPKAIASLPVPEIDEYDIRGLDILPGRRRSSSHFPRHGYGLQIIRRIMDGIEYERTPDGENLLTLTKRMAASARVPGSEKGERWKA
jgi:anti-sigma regulatory factor (Ser/Thr protein kinase)